MNFYLDEHLPPLLAQMLQERGIDCLTTQAAGNAGRTDEEQLAYAADKNRVFVTFNRKDFLLLAKDWLRVGRVFMQELFFPSNFRHLRYSANCFISSLSIVKIHFTTKYSGCRTTEMRPAFNSMRQPGQPDLSSFDTPQILLLPSVGYGFSLILNLIGTQTT